MHPLRFVVLAVMTSSTKLPMVTCTTQHMCQGSMFNHTLSADLSDALQDVIVDGVLQFHSPIERVRLVVLH